MQRTIRKASILLLLVSPGLFGLGVSGCAREEASELLVAYSGDCQAYLEPCG